MQLTTTPKYLDEPKPGKKNWTMKDESGVYFSVSPDMAQGMKIGVPVTLDYRVNNFNGKTFNMVERVYGAAVPTTHTTAVTPPTNPNPIQQGHNAPAHKNGDAKAREMFVMGCVGRAMGSGQFGVTDIKTLTLAAADAWDDLTRRDATENF